MHRYFLQQALKLAELQQGFCAPNPSVGAILVKQSEVIGQGFHLGPGTEHAEQNALNNALDKAEGASLYVTLEPCCHQGRTPPCTSAIINAGITEVYYGYQDPNPIVSGKGAKILQEAGIHCQHIELDDINQFYLSYHYWHTHKLPFVNLKLAMSMDGKIAAKDGQPIALTGPDLKIFTHKARKRSDAILTTLKTLIKDDPQLNVRLNGNIIAKPIFILDSTLQLPQNARVLRTCKEITLFYDHSKVTPDQVLAMQQQNVRCVAVNNDEADQLSLLSVLEHIAAQGVHELWVEAGGQCFESFVRDNLAQQAFIYIAPIWLGEQKQSAFGNYLQLLQGNATIEWKGIGHDGVCLIKWPSSKVV